MALKNTCQKCNGTGSFIGYSGRRVGDCFACNGTGSVSATSNGQGNQQRDPIPTYDLVKRMRDVWEQGGAPRVTLGEFKFKWWSRAIYGGHDMRIYVTKDDDRVGCIHIGLDGETTFASSWGVEGGTVEDMKDLLDSDLEEAMVNHGKLTGYCSCCGRKLTNPISVERGIGPICAEGYGF